MFDFIGNKLTVGDFVAYPGGGNRTVEYGQILMRVTKVEDDFVKCERLDVSYERGLPKIRVRNVRITNLNKLVKVNPMKEVVNLFDNPTLQPNDVATWLHGSEGNRVFGNKTALHL